MLSDDLTCREIAVVEMMALGLANKEIGHALGLKTTYIKSMSGVIFDKLGCRNRTQAVVAAFHDGIFERAPQPATYEVLRQRRNDGN